MCYVTPEKGQNFVSDVQASEMVIGAEVGDVGIDTAQNPLTLVTFVLCDLLGDVLDLQEQLDAFDGCHTCLGDGGGDASGQEVLQEGNGIGERHSVSQGTVDYLVESCERIAHRTASDWRG